MKRLWNFINKKTFSEKLKTRIFIIAFALLCGLAALCCAAFVALVIGLDIYAVKIAAIGICGYAVAVGFVMGIIYLYREN